MTKGRTIILLLTVAAIVTVWSLPCRAEQKDEKESIWTDEEMEKLGPRPERGHGPPEGGPRPERGPGPPRFELTDEEVNRIISSLKQSDPNKAMELLELRKKEPERFMAELKRYGYAEFDTIIKERIEMWRSRRRAEFLEWLNKSVPKEAEDLAKLKEKEPDLYAKKYDLAWQKYVRIFDQSRWSPELAEVLLTDLELEERQEVLLNKIKAAKSGQERNELISQLEEVVSDRYDLIVRRKQIAYERLLKRLEELQKQVKDSIDDIGKWRDETFKFENVRERIKYLIEENRGFKWR
jgi:hypothetical protein